MSLVTDLNEAFAPWAAGLSTKEVEALRWYQGKSHESLNRVLRVPDCEITDEQSETVRGVTRLLDAAIAAGRLPFEVRAYRGLRDYGALFGDAHPEDLPGAVIHDPAFVSTSVLAHRADRFVDQNQGFRLDFNVPIGHPAAWLPSVGVRKMESQRELLLPRGVEIEIVGSYTKEGILYVEGGIIE